MSKAIVYISGPMSKIRLYNFPAFDAARDDLEAKGYAVISPADLDREHGFDPSTLPADWDWNTLPESFSLMDAVDRDYNAIRSANEVCLLPGWQNSTGAQAEAGLARWMRKPVWEYAPEDILDEAARITRGDRQASYGPPDQDFRRTADMWTAMFGHGLRDGWRFEPVHVAQAMIALKLSRSQHSKRRDNPVDIAGYARCMDVCYRADGGY
jgi:hypothetical protein